MKRVISAFLTGFLLLAATAGPAAGTTAALKCFVVDSASLNATEIRVSDFMQGANNLYYVWVGSDVKRWDKAAVTITIQNSELREKKIAGTIKLLAAARSNAGFPFGVSDWGGISTYGSAKIVVRYWRGETYLGSATQTLPIVAP